MLGSRHGRFGLKHSWIHELLFGLLRHRVLGLVLNLLFNLLLLFFNWVQTEMLLEEEIGIYWFLSNVAARSSGIGYFSVARYSWLGVLQHRWVKSGVNILAVGIHLLHVGIFDSRSI